MNEDSFQCVGRIYPDTLDSREEKINNCEDFWQIYSVCDGLGGAGIGDIAGRVIQGAICELRRGFPLLDPMNFDFARYIQAFVDQADAALRGRLSRFARLPVGCSLALIMFAGDTAYTMSIGNCRCYLYRQQKLYVMTRDLRLNEDRDERPLLFFGNHPGSQHLRAHNLTEMTVQAGDQFLIVSDGFTRAMEAQDIQHVMERPSRWADLVANLFQTARRYDASEDQTILGLHVESRRVFADPYESCDDEDIKIWPGSARQRRKPLLQN